MKKITEKFENGLLVERITEETTDSHTPKFATGGVIPSLATTVHYGAGEAKPLSYKNIVEQVANSGSLR